MFLGAAGTQPLLGEPPPLPEHQKRSKLQSLGSEVLGNTVASEIKLKKEVSSGNLTAKSHTV